MTRLSLELPVSILAATLVSGCVVFEPPTGDRRGSDASLVHDTGARDAFVPGNDAWSAPDAWSSPDAYSEPIDAAMPPADAYRSCVVASIVTFDDCTGPVVINEVDGSGEDYVEIYNRSDAPVNLSNWVLTDDNAGSPDVAEGTIVPVGTVLEPHRFLFLWANLTAPQPGIRTDDCLPGAPPPCMHASWGISASGERVYLLDDALAIVCAFQYPSSVFGGEAFGRVVDGTDVLCPTNPTPGEANVASTMR